MEWIESIKDRFRLRRLESLDWITRNRLVMAPGLEAIKTSHEEHSRLTDRLKVLCWGMTPWERGGVELLLGQALKARGHSVTFATCQGGMSACSMESIRFPRPDCGSCQDRGKRIRSIFDMEEDVLGSDRFLDQDDLKEIEQLVESLPEKNWGSWEWDGVPIGALCKRDLPQFFFRLVDEEEEEVRTYFRRALKGVASHALLAKRYLDEVKPDRVIVTSGRTVSNSAIYWLCRHRGIDVITWDESVGGLGSFVIALNSIAVDYSKPRAWERIANEPLTKEEDQQLGAYLARTAQGQFGRHQYYQAPIVNRDALLKELDLDPEKPMVLLLTNLTWDTSALDKNRCFDGMIHWVVETIAHVSKRQDLQLVVRTHPAEGHVEAYARSCETVRDNVMKVVGTLPPNVRVISGHSEANSHVLCEMAASIAVYTTTVGLEMAIRGREVLACADAHYSRKGFTTEIETKEDYFASIERCCKGGEEKLDQTKISLAKKYAHFFIFRTESYLEEFNLKDRHVFRIEEPKHLLPEGSRRWDGLCRAVEHLEDFVDCTGYLDPWAGESLPNDPNTGT